MRTLILLSVWLVFWSCTLPGYSMPADRPEILPSDTLVADTVAAAVVEPPGFFALAEDSLKTLSLNIVRPPEDSVRLANNTLFANYLLEVLQESGSMHHPFDSLTTVSMLQPPDSGFRVITWYVPLSNQQFRYFGYIQYGDSLAGAATMPYHENGTDLSHDDELSPSHDDKTNQHKTNPSHDDELSPSHDDKTNQHKTNPSHDDELSPSHGDTINSSHDDHAYLYTAYDNTYAGGLAAGPSHEKGLIFPLREDARFAGDATAHVFTGSSWYGSYYYELITNRHAGEDHYVLLGWRGDNAFSRKRIIEPLSFRDGEPLFGAQVFDLEGHEPYRLVFEYSVRVSMGLLYDALYSRTRQAMTPMIVFDRLMPMQENLKGQYRHYVPVGEAFDGLIFSGGRWLLEEDVDARIKKKEEKP